MSKMAVVPGYSPSGLPLVEVTDELESVKIGARALAVTGVAIEAALSVAGMLTLTKGMSIAHPNLLAAASGFSALSIEWAVIYLNTYEGLDVAVLKDSLKLKMAQAYILAEYNRVVNDNRNRSEQDRQPQNEFIQLYADCYQALEERSDAHSKEALLAVEQLKLQMRWMEYRLLGYFENAAGLDPAVITCLDRVFGADKRQQFQAEYENKKIAKNICIAFNILSLPGSFFTSVFVLEVACGVLGVSAAICPPLVVSVAAVGMISYFFMMHNTFREIIDNDLIQYYWNKLKTAWYNAGNGCPVNARRIGIVLTAILFSALIFVLTMATLGTWVKSGIGGQLFLFHCVEKIVEVLVTLSSVLYTAIMIIFNIKNIAETIRMFLSVNLDDTKQRFYDWCQKIFVTSAVKLFTAESARAASNRLFIPLAILAYGLQVITEILFIAFNVLTFIAHCMSEGVTIDKPMVVNKWAAIVGNGAVEAGTDLPATLRGHKRPPKIGEGPHEIDVLDGKSHEHSNFLGWLAFIGFSPLLALNFLLCLATTKSNAPPIEDKASEDSPVTCCSSLVAALEASWEKAKLRCKQPYKSQIKHRMPGCDHHHEKPKTAMPTVPTLWQLPAESVELQSSEHPSLGVGYG